MQGTLSPATAGITLDVEGSPRELALADVTKALVQVELNRRRTATADADEDDLDDDAETDDEIEDED